VRRRILLGLGALIVVLAVTVGAVLARRDDDPDGAAASDGADAAEQLVEVTSGSISQTVDGEGTIEPETTADLAFGSPGTVTSVAVEVGDTVAAGDALAIIDSAQLEAELAEAQAAADEARASLDDADGDATDAEVAALDARVRTADLALLEAQQAVDGATLVAPVAGTVTVVDYAVGDVLGTSGADGSSQSGSDTPSGAQLPTSDDDSQGGGTSGIQVVSTGTYTVSVDVPATEVDQVAVGQEALVTPTTSSSSSSDSFGPAGGPGGMPPVLFGMDASDGASSGEGTASGDQVSGLVTEVAAVADTSSGVATFPVEITVQGRADAFFPGAIAEVEVVVSQRDDVIQVPALAVTTTDGTSTVTVADGDDREQRTVEVGESSGTMVEITSGLSVGEQVVVTLPGRPGGGGGDEGAPGGLVVEGVPPGAGPITEELPAGGSSQEGGG
jgi:macrolide-specific efflux system membrane fusion protein